jgi:Flp pilus assembly protein TadD
MRRLLAIALAVAVASPAPSYADEPDTVALIGQALDKGRLVQAAEMIRIARRDHNVPDLVRLDELEGRLALIEGRPGDAFAAYDRVLRVEQDNCRALEGAGLAALALDRMNAAHLRFEHVVQHCPERWRSWDGLGVVADRAGNWAEAEKAYHAAREIDPDNVTVINNLGYSLILQARFAEAEALLREGLLLAPGDQRLLHNLDLACIGADKPLPEDVMPTDPEQQAERLNNAGYMAHLMGKDNVAERYLRQALAVSPSFYRRAADNLDLVLKGKQAK